MVYNQVNINDLEAMKITIKRERIDENLTEAVMVYYYPLYNDVGYMDVCLCIADDLECDSTEIVEIENMIFKAIGYSYIYGFEDNYYLNEEHTIDNKQTEEYYYTYSLKPVFAIKD